MAMVLCQFVAARDRNEITGRTETWAIIILKKEMKSLEKTM